MSKFNRIKHIVRYTIILILILYFGIIAVLSIPGVQRGITRMTEKELRELFQTEVSIENVNLGLFNRIIIQDINIKDRNNGELLKISRLSAKFELSPLFHGKIRISSVQLFGLNARLNKATPESEANFQFILDTFASKDSIKKESNIDLRINALLIRRGQIHYDLLSAEETPSKFNPNHIGINNLSATLSLKALTKDSLNAQIKRMSFNEQSGFKLKKLTTRITANKQHFKANNFEIQLPNTEIHFDRLTASYDSIPSAFPSLKETTTYAGQTRIKLTPSDLACFIPALADFSKPIEINFAINGKGNQTRCTDFQLTNSENTIQIKAKGFLDRWDEPKMMSFAGEVSELTADTKGISWLIQSLSGNDDISGILKRIQFINFNGDISGKLKQLTTHGQLNTGIGDLLANVTMNIDSLSKRRSYSGQISSEALDLGVLLDKQQTFGKTTFDVELKGFQYNNGNAESYIKGIVSSFTYQQYEYKNIQLDGQYTPGGFNGKLAINDDNAQIEINGDFATRKPIPTYNLTAIVRKVRPYNLNLVEKKYKDTDFSMNLISRFQGHTLDDLYGLISVDSLTVNAPENEKSYYLQNLSITAGNMAENGKKRIDIRSSFMNGTIDGEFSYHTLPASIIKTVQHYIPSLLNISKELPETDNNFKFNIQVDNSELFSKVLDIPLELKLPATLNGFFDDDQTRLHIRGYLPEFVYKETYYEGGNLLCDNSGEALQVRLYSNKRMNNGSMLSLGINATAENDKVMATVNWGNNTSSTFSGKVETIAYFSKSESRGNIAADIQIQPSQVILNDSIWEIHPSQIKVDKDIIEINNFLFEHGNQYVQAHGRIGKEETDSCLIKLKDINLQYVMNIIQFRAVKFNGRATGDVHLKHLLNNPMMQTRLEVQNFQLNDALLGKADILGSWDNKLGGVQLLADIREDEKYFTRLKGYVSPKQKGLDLNIQAGGTRLAFLQPFIDGIFSNMRGRGFGNVRLFGPFSKLDLEGSLNAEASVKVNILNTSFKATADSVKIRPGYFGFNNVRLTDNDGNTGTVNGSISHTKLKNLMYNFRFNTQNMLVYHTEKETPDFPFYGKIYSSGRISLRGGNNTLNVDGNLRIDQGTRFTYVTTTAAEATSTQFITFFDKTPKREQETVITELYHPLNVVKQNEADETTLDMHINLQIEATTAGLMKIIMDPLAGDNISARGNGNLQINYYNKGDFNMFGNYVIEEGVYKMSMQNIIRKDFTLNSGGIVSFNGNPRQANLNNVQAVYTVNSVSLNDLVPDASNTKGTVRVNCIANLSGILTSPTMTFDLELPTVSDEDRELVRSLTSTEEQMNTQIIYLLSIGKFYTYDYTNNNNQSDATSSLAFSTLSGQLNNMLSQVINSQNWNVGTNLSTGDKGWTDVEAEAILTGRLLNNRLIINGNFGYRDNPMRNSNFVGDFEAMWLLNKNGEFRLKGYNQTNDRYFTKSTMTTQGVGLMYKKDFTNWRELIDWMLLKNRRKRSTKEEKPEAAAQQKREQQNNIESK